MLHTRLHSSESSSVVQLPDTYVYVCIKCYANSKFLLDLLRVWEVPHVLKDGLCFLSDYAYHR